MASLRDVARRAGVSVSTASKVLNGRMAHQHFGPDCIARIREAATALRYTPNYLARSLASRRADSVGLLMGPGSMSANDFWGEVLWGLGEGLSATGQHLVTLSSRDGPEHLALAHRFLQDGRIDGLVLLSFDERLVLPASLFKARRPVVLLGCAHRSAPTVAVDDEAGVAAAVRHLAELGHRRIAWYGPGDDEDSSCARRQKACRRAAREAGLRLDERLFSWRPALGDRVRSRSQRRQIASVCVACRAQADLGSGATGIVCYDDLVAFGLYAAAAERGLRIPHDLSVVGFDDIHAEVVWPPLTTVSHMLRAVGQRAATLLQELIEDPTLREAYAGRRELLQPELVIRGSTAPPREPAG